MYVKLYFFLFSLFYCYSTVFATCSLHSGKHFIGTMVLVHWYIQHLRIQLYNLFIIFYDTRPIGKLELNI